MNTTVREENTSDHDSVYKLIVDAFEKEEEARLVDLLRTDPCFIPELSIVSCIDDQIVGHILFTKIYIVENSIRHLSLALAPMAVDPLFQNKGIGGQLIMEGHRRARDLGYTSVIVLGHEHYYPRFGYQPADIWNIRCPYPAPRESFMGIELVPGSLERVTGLVEYAAAFSML